VKEIGGRGEGKRRGSRGGRGGKGDEGTRVGKEGGVGMRRGGYTCRSPVILGSVKITPS